MRCLVGGGRSGLLMIDDFILGHLDGVVSVVITNYHGVTDFIHNLGNGT